ncbi:MAG: ATP-binding protein [Deltaproteobacteria bacterium]
MTYKFDFTNIKGDTIESQRSAFEQLVCHLAQLDERGGEFRRIEGAGGDGGVEAIRILPTGKKVGYQAKYYPIQKKIDWSKIDDSVEAALKQHPELECYVIALPCVFSGNRATRGGSTEGVWGKWDEHVKKWKVRASELGINVEFEVWTAFQIETALCKPNAQHHIQAFFAKLVFSPKWIKQNLDRTIHDLQARYSPTEHVDTESLKPFDLIFRRDNIRRDLRSIFDVARNSNPRAAVALSNNISLADETIDIVENAIEEFLELEIAIDSSLDNKWPIIEWLTSWHSLVERLYNITDIIEIASGNDIYNFIEHVSELTKVYELGRPEVFGGHWWRWLPIEGSRAVLFVGRAGAGKSHLLARAVEIASSAGVPVVHILGQDISAGDPRMSILKRLDIAEWKFRDMLSALNFAAETAKTRALLVIDALDEGHGIEVWRNHIASFIREVNQFDRIFLVVSCREEYLEYVVPGELMANPNPYPRDGDPPKDCEPLGKFVRVNVEGFRSSEEREAALQKFMDEKGIARPTAPILDDEFFNPLFMSSVCRAMARAEIKVFPRGLHGTRDIFEFVIKTKSKALGTHYDGTDQIYRALKTALDSLAGIMVKNRKDYVPLRDAINLINEIFKVLPVSNQSWLSVLEGADILRRDIEKSLSTVDDWSIPEVIRFSFQRLQDNLIANRLVKEFRNLELAFEPNAPFEFLIKRSVKKDGIVLLKPNPKWAGVLSALWTAVAEKYGKELWYLPSFFGSTDVHFYPRDFQSIFQASIRERSEGAFTKHTKAIFDRLWEELPEEKFAIFLSTSCVPNHAWNVHYLIEQLLNLSLAERDSEWSRYFTNNDSELIDRAEQITNWALNIDVKLADDEVVWLAGMTLTCFFTVTNRPIRDRATKALVNLLVGKPELFPFLLNRFQEIDDLYVLERLLAAGYGAICLEPTNERIIISAQSVADTIFATKEPPVHLAIRDWACSILEYADSRGIMPENFNMARSRPPFGSSAKDLNVTIDELEEIAKLADDDTIADSCQRHHDFFQYEIIPAIMDFSEIPLTDPPPLTQDERASNFEAEVRKIGGLPVVQLENLLTRLEAIIAEERRSMLIPPRLNGSMEKALRNAEEAFLIALPQKLKSEYTTELAPKINRIFEPPKARNPEPIGLFVAKRAYQYGWNKNKFPKEPHSSDRGRPVIERIGKKYQWLALEEAMARLADNYWINADLVAGTRRYQCRQDAIIRDRIDPTILPPIANYSPIQPDFTGPPVLIMEDVDELELASWPYRDDHFNEPEPWLLGLLDGRPSLIADWTETINEKNSNNQIFDPFRRQIQAFVSLVVHKVGFRELLVKEFFNHHSSGIDRWDLKIKADGYFAHEIKLQSVEKIPFWTHPINDKLEIASPIVTGIVEDVSDQSIKNYTQFTVPHPHILNSLKLIIPNPRDTGVWLLPDGQVFLKKLEDRGSPILLDKEHFDSWCQSEGLEYTWVYIGERTAWTGKHKAKWRRTIGAAWFENGKLQYKNEQIDTSSP